MTKLTTVLGEYPQVCSLLSGDVPLAGYAIEAVEVRPIISAYRRMIQALEFDICELAPVTYLMALQAGLPITAIPVFLNRRFHHGDVQCAAGSGIAVPTDLEGRRVGVRAYSVSTGVWARGVLSEEYGVDIDSITWIVDDDDHIDGRTPGNVRRVTDGRSLGELLRLAEIDAAFTGNAGTGRAGAPRPGWTSAAESAPHHRRRARDEAVPAVRARGHHREGLVSPYRHLSAAFRDRAAGRSRRTGPRSADRAVCGLRGKQATAPRR